jgi:hypothetical protein
LATVTYITADRPGGGLGIFTAFNLQPVHFSVVEH